jgi:hypothetical protein
MSTADAALLHLEATGGTDPEGFDVFFDDTGDGLLQYDEIVSSAGIVFADGFAFPWLAGVPNIDGVSTAGGPCESPDDWCFVNVDEGIGVTIGTDFIYSITIAAVPEPGMMSLFTLGVGGLLVRLRRRSKTS